MNIFYEPNISSNETEILLNEQEASHALKVLRHKAGDQLYLTDGKGAFYDAEIVSTTKKHCWLKVLARYPVSPPRPYRHLVIAPLKNRNRMEWMVEKAVELGVYELSLVRMEHAQRGKVNHQRMERLLVSAMKQSMRAMLPLYQAFDSLEQCLAQKPLTDQKLIAECETAQKPHLGAVYHPGKPVDMIFGPEGDFSQRELALVQTFGFQSVSLGPQRMRAETAPVASLSMLEVLDANRPH